MIREVGGRLCIGGPVTLENVMKLREESAQFFGKAALLVDFSEVEGIDSASVSLMLEWMRKARSTGCDVRFTNLGESISSLIDLYGVEDLIPLGAN